MISSGMMAATKIMRMYALGSNGCGQLGVGHTEDLSNPEPCCFNIQHTSGDDSNCESLHELRGDTIRKIVGGGNHTLMLTENGQVFATGNNDDGRCGIEGEPLSKTSFHPVQIPDRNPITDIAASWSASYFVEERRKVFVIGSGDKGELGLGQGVTHSSTTRQVFEVEGDHEILSIAAGMSHVIILLSDGRLHGWGACRKGQLGEEKKQAKICWNPHAIPVPFKVQGIAVGRDYTVISDNQAKTIALGDTKYLTDLSSQSMSVSKNFQSGWSSILFLRCGQLDGIGRNDRGQLPSRYLEAVKIFATGSEHTVAVTTSDDVKAWGWGEHGNCGIPVDHRGSVVGRVNTLQMPLRSGECIAGLGAGCATTFIWTAQGE